MYFETTIDEPWRKIAIRKPLDHEGKVCIDFPSLRVELSLSEAHGLIAELSQTLQDHEAKSQGVRIDPLTGRPEVA